MKISKRADVIYPIRIPRDVFKQARKIAERMDTSTSKFIRAALREKIAATEDEPRKSNEEGAR